MPFLSTLLDVRTANFHHLLNPDWSIQTSRAPAVCKEIREQLVEGIKNSVTGVKEDTSLAGSWMIKILKFDTQLRFGIFHLSPLWVDTSCYVIACFEA